MALRGLAGRVPPTQNHSPHQSQAAVLEGARQAGGPADVHADHRVPAAGAPVPVAAERGVDGADGADARRADENAVRDDAGHGGT